MLERVDPKKTIVANVVQGERRHFRDLKKRLQNFHLQAHFTFFVCKTSHYFDEHNQVERVHRRLQQ